MLARCAHCQKTFETDRYGVQACPHCGAGVLLAAPGGPPPGPPASAPPPSAGAPGWGAPPPPPGSGPAAPPGAVPPGGPEASAPFVHRKQMGFLAAFFQTWKLAAVDSAAFFRMVKVNESSSAVLFGVVALTVSQWFQAAYGYLMGAATQGVVQEMMRRLPQADTGFDPEMLRIVAGASVAGFAGRVIAAPVYALVSVFLTAGIVHLFLILLRGAPRGFAATLTVVGYASGVQLVAAAPIPLLAPLVAFVWFLVVVVLGLAEAQRCGAGKAALATLLPGVLGCACCCAGAATVMKLVAGAAATKVDGGVSL
jgi:hypothetical protein